MENTWPSLSYWKDIPDTVSTRRAVYGKVHRAPTDYRWIGWSAAFGSSPSSRELTVNTHELPGATIAWRSSPSTGPFAVRFYSSRAFDAAGRPAGAEKQILAPLSETYGAIPAVALAVLLLDAASPFDDTIWWDHWRNPAWSSISHALVIDEKDCPLLEIGQLEAKIGQGLEELLSNVDEASLIHFYAQLLAGTAPAVLATQGSLLSPLAMAALLLPLDRRQTEECSIAGGVVPAPGESSKEAKWNQLICTIDNADATVAASDPLSAVQLVELLKLGRANGGQLPSPPSPGGSYLEGFLKSEGRWLAPGMLGTEALQLIGPWPTVKRAREAAKLRTLVADFRVEVIQLTEPGADPDELQHKVTKLELLQSLLIALCPGPDTFQCFNPSENPRVPALYFLSRIEPEDWDDLVRRYSQEQFQRLAEHSLDAKRIQPLARAVREFLEAQDSRDRSSPMAQYAAAALRAVSRS